MKVLLIGATGMIGRAILNTLGPDHEVLTASRSSDGKRVDMSNPNSLRALFEKTGPVDAIICVAGDAAIAPFATMSDDDFKRTMDVQMKGQMNVLRLGREAVRPGGSITVTSGISAQNSIPGTSAIAAACAAIESYVRVAAAEDDSIRLNAVSPVFVKETMALMGPLGGVD